MPGFFPDSPQSNGKLSVPLLPACGKCRLCHDCRSPKMSVDGQGEKGILLYGEAPGQQEDRDGIPFCGKSGQLLESTLDKFGVDMRRDCWITNSLICHPKHPDGSNRKPSDKEIGWCRPNLVRAVKELKPRVIIPMGECAVKSLLGWLWRPKVGAISRWDGWRIPDQTLNAWVCPTWHPAWILRGDYGSGKENDVRGLLFERHIRAACRLEGRPWETVPDFAGQVKVLIDPEEAGEVIGGIASRNRPVAWDIETNMLKPDSKDARIICCSMSDGEYTIAFPWHGAAREAVKRFIRSDVPKIGCNIKFENRWMMNEFGCSVRNWAWDGMTAAHVLDNRGGHITGLEFQAYVLLGQPPWDQAVAKFMEADGSNERNKLDQVDLPSLLKYCGTDALLEWHVARIQRSQIHGRAKHRKAAVEV